MHNYKTIAQALPADLRTPNFHVADETLLQHTAAGKIRNKRLQESKTKQSLLVSQITSHVSRNPNNIPNTESSGSQLVESLENDGDLLTILQNVLAQQDEGGLDALADGVSGAGCNDGMGGEGDGNTDTGNDNNTTTTNVDVIVGPSESAGPSITHEPIFSSSAKGKGKALPADTMYVHEFNLNLSY